MKPPVRAYIRSLLGRSAPGLQGKATVQFGGVFTVASPGNTPLHCNAFLFSCAPSTNIT
mgnify:CR=1 FL=1